MTPATPFELALDEERELGPVPVEGGTPGGVSPLSWVHPGQGDGCGSSGEPKGWWGHSTVLGRVHANPIVPHCDSFGCPICWRRGWMNREADHIADVLFTERAERIKLGRSRGVIHFSVDPPPGEYEADRYSDPKAYARVRAKASAIAKAAGVELFQLTPHHERCADREDPETTDGLHWHGQGFGWIDGGQFARSGWVVKNHGLRESRRSVIATARYYLSHSSRLAGISPMGKSASPILVVTWYGRTARLPIVTEKGRRCRVCDELVPLAEVFRLIWEGTGPPPDEPTETDPSLWRAVVIDRTGWFTGEEHEVEL